MRLNMRLLVGEYVRVVGRISHFAAAFDGEKDPRAKICVVNLHSIDGDYITDHLWVRATSDMNQLGLKRNSIMSFTGLVEPYIRKGGVDYGLLRVTGPCVISEEEERGVRFLQWEKRARQYAEKDPNYVPSSSFQSSKTKKQRKGQRDNQDGSEVYEPVWFDTSPKEEKVSYATIHRAQKRRH